MTSKLILKLTLTSLAVCASLSAFAQYNPAPNPFGQTGYAPDGTLFMGGQKIGNPHQILHDLNVPSFFGVNANRLSFSDNPSYGQGTLAQMENHTLTIGVPAGNVVLSRLYVTPTNPYTQGVATPHNNYQTYQGVLTSASAASYQLTAADDGKMYAFRTLSAPNQQSMNILIKELPNTSQFKGSSDLKGGATGVHVTQNGDAAALSAYMSTLKPYDFSWRAALAPYANNPNTGAFVANWVMGSHQVQTYQADMQNKSMQTGNEAFGVLAWDANQNKYVMLDPSNQQATAGSVSGNMPTLGSNQFGFFGMHTHGGSATLSDQDLKMTQQLGLDQMVIGTNGTMAIMTNNPGNDWQGAGFEFEERKTLTISYGGSIYGGKGGGVQTGLYLTYDKDSPSLLTDLGYYKSIEAGTGIGLMGVGIQGGVVLGDKDTLSGTSYNKNVSALGLSGTVTTDGKGNIIGGSLGPAATIGGVASTEVNTTTTSFVTGTDGGTVSVDTMGNSTGSSAP